MAETSIEWTASVLRDGRILPGYTFNGWEGCEKVSPGCKHCYAEVRNGRFHGGENWGPAGSTPRLLRSPAYWKQPERWNREAAEMGIRRRVFCASLSDVFEDHGHVVAERSRLFELIEKTTALDWLLLTKRPENATRLAPGSWASKWPDNVWAGTTAENAEELARRAPHLRAIPARVRFLSCEPLLGALDNLVDELCPECKGCTEEALSSMFEPEEVRGHVFPPHTCDNQIHWAIVGGESGRNARPFLIDWARRVVVDCHETGRACFVKQMGDNPHEGYDGEDAGDDPGDVIRPVKFRAHHGADPSEWPASLRVRQFPREALRVTDVSGGRQ